MQPAPLRCAGGPGGLAYGDGLQRLVNQGLQPGQGVDLVGRTGTALSSIVQQVVRIDQLVSEIASSAQEQALGLSEVNTAVNDMDQVVQQNAAMVEQSTAATMALKNEASELARMVGRFRIAGGDTRPEVLRDRDRLRALAG